MTQRVAVMSIVLGMLPGLGVPAFAAAQATHTPGSRSPQADTRLGEVIVTAQKREEHLQRVPISVALLHGDEIDRFSLVSITEALNTVAGVAASVGYQGGTTLVTVRGVGASGPLLSGSSPIAYYLDSSPFGLVTSAIAPDAGAYDLKRIEVLRGPQGTLYGANAQNGVIRVLTEDASTDELGLKARVTLSGTEGGGDNYRADAAVNVPLIEGKLGARAVVGYSDFSGWVDGPVGNDINSARLRTYRLKLNAEPDDALSIVLSAWKSSDDHGAPSASDDRGQVSATIPQPIAADFETYGLQVSRELSRFSVSSSTSYLDYSNRSTWDLSAVGLSGLALDTDLDSRVVAQEFLLNSRAGGAWRWTAGLSYRDADDRLLQTSVILPAPLDYSFASRSFAVFAEAGRRFADDRFEWALGLRYFHDHVVNEENVQGQGQVDVPLYRDTATFESTTPRVVLTWFAREHLTMYGSYGEGFRSGFPQNAAVIQAAPGFPPLEPDELRNFEVGAKGSLTQRVSFDAAVYYLKWKDVQQSLSVLFNGVPVVANVNGESASGAGIDLGVSVRPAEDWDFSLQVGWNDLTLDGAVDVPAGRLFDAGDRLNYSPEWTGSAAAGYRFRLGSGGFNGSARVSASYSSGQDFRGNTTGTAVIHGDALLIARAQLVLDAPGGWSAVLFADNIADESGATPTVNLLPEWQLRVRPRTLGVQLDFHF